MKRWLRLALFIVLGLLIVAQLIPIDRSVPETAPEADFLNVVQAPMEMATLIKEACYDCHAYATEYPWYARVAPVSFWIQHHVDEGREHLNFNTWSSYEPERAAHKLEECWEEVEEGHMPMPSFTWLHPEARLTEAQRGALAQWFQQQYRAMESGAPEAMEESPGEQHSHE